MKAAVAQQRSLLEVAELDAELSRIAHRASHLPERQDYERMQTDQVAANDRLGALQIALEDLDAQVSRFESEIDAVRQREDRDRSLLQSVADAKQLSELQHELETLQRRQSSLEDSLLEVMEHREQLQAQQTAEVAAIEALQADLAAAQQALDGVLGRNRPNSPQSRDRGATNSPRRWIPSLIALYERQRAGGGPGAGPLQGRRCGACRIEIDRGELARISAAADDDVLRCPECGAILLRVKGATSEGHRRSRRRVARQPGAGGLRVGGLDRGPVDRAGREQAGDRACHQQRRRISRPDRRFGGGGEAERHRGRGVDGFQAGGRADVRALEGQASRPRGAQRQGARTGVSGSSGSATRGFREQRTPTPIGWPTRRWTPRRGGRAGTDGNSATTAQVKRDPVAAGLDRRARYRHPAAVAASRPDRAVGAAALFGPRQPGADRARPAAGRRGGPVSGAAWRHRGGGQLAAATLLRHRGGCRQSAGLGRDRRRRPDRDRFRRMGRLDVRRGRRTRSRIASTMAARHQHRAARAGKASTT